MIFIYIWSFESTKIQHPLRLTICIVNSSYYKLARWLAQLLERIRRRMVAHSLNDTFKFSEEMNHLNISDWFVVSFDAC